ncbi:hypothetical protein [Robertmurraya massiliosenegalensis]|uniref:hypothetical protein n=1 Tax=Robertmurraya massiliosenegalensis TaxID=1287657 RepID=UPI0002E66E10|nr:hypothetical protein [Robertmurraya massiliosenegalensis]
MLKTIDVGLMANHLPAHKGVIHRLEIYENNTKDLQLNVILKKQIIIMENHVKVMNQLLNQTPNIVLPPIPQDVPMNNNHTMKPDTMFEDSSVALDVHFTATAMAKENFLSASNMKDPQAKKLHVEMALQQLEIAKQYEMLAQQLGWLTHPNASDMERNAAISPNYPVPNHPTMVNKNNSTNLYMNNQNNIN